MNENTKVGLHDLLLESMQILLQLSTEIAVYSNPTNYNKEFLDEQEFHRNQITKISSGSPYLVIQQIREKAIEMKIFMEQLIKNQHGDKQLTYLTVTKRRRDEFDLGEMDD